MWVSHTLPIYLLRFLLCPITYFRCKRLAHKCHLRALWIKRKRSINAGIAQVVFDSLLFLVAAFYLPINQMTWSAVGTIAMNLVLIIWLKPGRYHG